MSTATLPPVAPAPAVAPSPSASPSPRKGKAGSPATGLAGDEDPSPSLPFVSSVPNSVSSAVKSALPGLRDVRDRAWTLYCQGQRSPAIAQQLHVPERTVRDWLQRIREQLAEEADEAADDSEDSGASHAAQLAIAVERHLAVAVAAWADHDRLAHAQQLILAQLESAASTPSASVSPGSSGSSVVDAAAALARLSAAGTRALAVALAAQRAVARLQGLHLAPPPPQQQIEFHISRHPDGPVDLDALAAQDAAEAAAQAEARRAAREAEDAALDADYADYAADDRTDATSPLPAGRGQTKCSPSESFRGGAGGEETQTEIPAETATPPASAAPARAAAASASPLPAGRGVGGEDLPIPHLRYWAYDPILGCPVRRTGPAVPPAISPASIW
jgi:hypothetical protein